MPAPTKQVPRSALIAAVVGSIVVGILFGLAQLGVWMANENLHPTPRVNAFTVGMGLTPLPALAWILYVWTRTRPAGIFDFAVRVTITIALLLGAYVCVGLSLFDAFFVG